MERMCRGGTAKTNMTRGSMTMLFDDLRRTHMARANYTEDGFSFLNRSAQPAAARMREILEQWYREYPPPEQEKLRIRFREEFEAAFFELFLHALLRRHPAEVEVHADVAQEGRRTPDFRVAFSDSQEAFVEATVSYDMSHAERADEARLSLMCEELEKLYSPNFWLGFRHIENPSGIQAPTRKIRVFLKRELDKLSPDQVEERALQSGGNDIPSLTFREGDFEVEFSIIPKKSGARRGTVGIFPCRSRWGGSDRGLLAALARKATRYGKLDRPYIIAVNALSPFGVDNEDISRALLGSVDFRLSEDPMESATDADVKSLWIGPNGQQNTRVSAVLLTTVVPWNMARAQLTLYHNPFAQRPCWHFPWRIRQATPGESGCERTRGEGTGDILGLPSDWPGALFPRDS